MENSSKRCTSLTSLFVWAPSSSMPHAVLPPCCFCKALNTGVNMQWTNGNTSEWLYLHSHKGRCTYQSGCELFWFLPLLHSGDYRQCSYESTQWRSKTKLICEKKVRATFSFDFILSWHTNRVIITIAHCYYIGFWKLLYNCIIMELRQKWNKEQSLFLLCSVVTKTLSSLLCNWNEM